MRHFYSALSLLAAVFLVALPARAGVINLNTVSVATAVDEGQQDGVFEAIDPVNLGLVNNNGYSSYRTSFEFDLAGLPGGATINSARLTVVLSNFEGLRGLELHGYPGSGAVRLADFALNGLVGTALVDASGTQTLVFDVTNFVAGLAADGQAFAGFNVREEPANSTNFTVMFLELGGVPGLSIEFSTERIVDVDIRPGHVPNRINVNSMGSIPVAILSGATFDAFSEIDAASLAFGRTGEEASLESCKTAPMDVNGDGIPDLVCRFRSKATGLLIGDTQGVLKGRTLTGVTIKGTDSVRVVESEEDDEDF